MESSDRAVSRNRLEVGQIYYNNEKVNALSGNQTLNAFVGNIDSLLCMAAPF